MKKLGRILKTIYWAITCVAVAASLTTATYAWFTSNHTVVTDTASGRTGSESLELQMSSQGGGAFTPQEEAPITQVNDVERLIPVSTANLQTFVYNPTTVEEQARVFQEVEGERYYYHGRVYIRAQGDGLEAGSRMALYLDQAMEAGGVLGQDVSGQLLSAARLGLVFNGDTQNPLIFRFGDVYNSSGSQGNTYINGVPLGDGQVLAWNGSGVSAVADPSVSLDSYTIQMDGSSVVVPQEPLLYMDLNQVYTIDVYFYLEGCDPDCGEDLYYDDANLHLAFYGLLSQEVSP